jgi:uncharacterized membrane protein
MSEGGHLWAIGYDDIGQAEQVRAEVRRLAASAYLDLLDTAVIVRYPDGSVTLDGEQFVAAVRPGGRTAAGFLAALALGAPPLTGAAVGAWVGHKGGAGAEVGIDDIFLRDVETLMRPGTSALFVLDREGDLAAILRGLRGLGGTVLKANVALKRAQLIQSTLAASHAGTLASEGSGQIIPRKEDQP